MPKRKNVLSFKCFRLRNLWKNFLDQIFYAKFHWLWKINLLDQIFLWKISLYVENLLPSLQINNSSKNLKQLRHIFWIQNRKVVNLPFFAVDKVNIIFNRKLKHKYGTFNACQKQKFIYTKSNLQSKTANLWKYS